MESESVENTKKIEEIILFEEIYKICPIWCEKYVRGSYILQFGFTANNSLKLKNTHIAKEFLKSYAANANLPYMYIVECFKDVPSLALYELKCLCEFVIYKYLKENN